MIADAQRLFSGALGLALGRNPDLDVVEERPVSGPAAADAVELFRPDVAVLDYWLEGLDGPGVARRVAAAVPDCKVLILSWVASAEHIQEAIEAGAAGFILKSRSVSKLAVGIRRAHSGESPVFARELQRLSKQMRARYQAAERFESAVQTLSPREFQILLLLGSGRLIEEISRELDIATATVTSHINAILKKTGARSHAEVLAMARDAGILEG